jgi:hypothetical protein
LPKNLRMLEASTSPYPLRVSDDLQAYDQEVRREILASSEPE